MKPKNNYRKSTIIYFEYFELKMVKEDNLTLFPHNDKEKTEVFEFEKEFSLNPYFMVLNY